MKPRKIFKTLIGEKSNRKISILLGPRQVGKTTLLKELYQTICTDGKNKGVFLDLDIISNFEKISTFENAVNFLKLSGYEKSKKSFFYLFLDEFQRYGGLTRVLKNLYDTYDTLKIYATGSSSITIKDQMQDSLAGRKKINNIYPLDFEEFLWFKEKNEEYKTYKNINKLKGKELFNLVTELNSLLFEFMVFGGYPEVTLQKEISKKSEVLESIFDLYIKKDLVDYIKPDKMLVMKQVIEHLAVNNGQKIKYEELSSITGANLHELRAFLEILKESYLIVELRPYFTNKNKEIVKIPKLYFIDCGVRNFFIKNFNDLKLRSDAGFLFETYVISEFLKHGLNNIKFWQDKNKREVDVIVDLISRQIPCEVKFKKDIKQEDIVGIKAYLDEYPKSKPGYIVNLARQEVEGYLHFLLPYNLAQNILN